ncbi:uncharacterized, partial [Tachysurus ichikawai]
MDRLDREDCREKVVPEVYLVLEDLQVLMVNVVFLDWTDRRVLKGT